MAESVLKLKVDSQEYDSKIRRAQQGLMALDSSLSKAGKTFADCDKEQLKFIQELGKMDTVSRDAKGKVNELSSAFVNLTSVYNKLSAAEKQSESGRALSRSLDELRQRAIHAKAEVANLNKQLEVSPQAIGSVSSAGSGLNAMLGELGGRFGLNSELLSTLTTGTVAYTAAIGAGVTAVVAATKAWADYNSEFGRQSQVTTVTTGLKGDSADNMTRSARALSRAFDVDFRETINAANTLMTQFGVSGSEAIRLITDGLQGMILGDGPKLLSMIQQYGPAFRNAGVSASELVAVIQNSEGGIFTDQNMQAIVFGISRIRTLSGDTAKALGSIGVNADEMQRKMRDGSMTVFEALGEVAGAIDKNKDKIGEVDKVMTDVFGRSARMAGLNLGQAIATLNTNLQETKQQTGELGEAVVELARAHEQLERSIQDAFGYKGWETMKTELETGLVVTLNDVVKGIANIRAAFSGMQMSLSGDVKATDIFFQHMREGLLGILNPALAVVETLRGLGQMVGFNKGTGMGSVLANAVGGLDLSKATQPNPSDSYKPFKPSVGRIGGGGRNSVVHEKTEEQKIQEKINKLVEEAYKADDARREVIRGEVAKLQEQLDKYKAIKDSVLGIVKAEKPVKAVNYESVTGGFTADNANGLKQMITSQMNGADMGSAAYAQLQQNLGDLSMLTNVIQQAVMAGLTIPEDEVNAMWEAIFDGNNLPEGVFDSMIEKFAAEWKEKTGEELVYDKKSGKIGTNKGSEKADPLDVATKVSGSLSSIVSGLQQLGIDVPKEIQAVVSGIQVLTGIVSAISAIVSLISAQETVQTVLAPIPGLSRGGVVPKAAGGWVVPGVDFSGDHVPILANSGEVVLNRAEVGNLASALQGGDGGNLQLTTRIDGEQLLIAINRASVRRGRGAVAMT